MQVSEAFSNTINAYLIGLAQSDSLFAETFKKPNKNLADCATYILNEIQKSGCNGFADDEIYAMAVHYYDEDKIDIGKPINAKVVVNHSLPADKKEAVKPVPAKVEPTKAVSQKAEPVKAIYESKPLVNKFGQSSLF